MSSGLDGLSAYEIAVANGFVGSEAAWLASLKGERGEDGAPAEAVPLEVIRDMVADAVAHLPIPEAGPQGEPGEPGPVGPPGPACTGPKVPWRSTVERDAANVIQRVLLGPTGEAPRLVMIPVRDDDGLVTSVDYLPLGIGQ